MRWVAIFIIRAYQLTLSRIIPPVCRFKPTCSNYALTAIRRFGFLMGSWLAFKRLLRCHPGNPGGYDPVPESPTGSEKITEG